MTSPHAFWVAGRRATGADSFDVTNPYDGRLVGTVSVPTDAQVEEAVAAAHAVRDEFAATPAHVRAAALDHVVRRLTERTEEIAQLISAENGKPIKWARGEVGRAVSVFRFAAEEARRFNGGEAQRLDTDLGGTGRLGLTRRFPRGAVLGIAPFNFPLNLSAHKVAPAIAVGAPIILKPAPATPISSLILGELLAETDLPAYSWSVLTVPNDRMPALVQDERLPVISFTGSGPVGYAIMESVPRKHCTLEARRQRRGHRPRRLRVRGGPRLGRHPDRHVLQLPGRPVLHLRAARHRRRRRLRPARPEDRRRRRGPRHR